MPINACSINAFTIDGSICRSYRVPTPTPIFGGKPRSIPALLPRTEDETAEYASFESNDISISLMFRGETFTLAGQLDIDSPVVLISGFKMQLVKPEIKIEHLSRAEEPK